MSASPDSFSRIRRYAGPPSSVRASGEPSSDIERAYFASAATSAA